MISNQSILRFKTSVIAEVPTPGPEIDDALAWIAKAAK